MTDELEVDMEWTFIVAPADHNEWPAPHRFFVATLSINWIGLECACGVYWFKRRDTDAVLHLQESAGVLEPTGPPQHFRLRSLPPPKLPRLAGE